MARPTKTEVLGPMDDAAREVTGSARRAIWSLVDERAVVRHHSRAGEASVSSVIGHAPRRRYAGSPAGDLSFVMAGHSASIRAFTPVFNRLRTRVHARMSQPSTTFSLAEKTWVPTQANLCSLRKLGCKSRHDAESSSPNNWKGSSSCPDHRNATARYAPLEGYLGNPLCRPTCPGMRSQANSDSSIEPA